MTIIIYEYIPILKKVIIIIFNFSVSDNLKCHIFNYIYNVIIEKNKELLLLPEVQFDAIYRVLQVEYPSVCRHILQFKGHAREQFSAL